MVIDCDFVYCLMCNAYGGGQTVESVHATRSGAMARMMSMARVDLSVGPTNHWRVLELGDDKITIGNPNIWNYETGNYIDEPDLDYDSKEYWIFKYRFEH